jgi:hypothetical protein
MVSTVISQSTRNSFAKFCRRTAAAALAAASVSAAAAAATVAKEFVQQVLRAFPLTPHGGVLVIVIMPSWLLTPSVRSAHCGCQPLGALLDDIIEAAAYQFCICLLLCSFLLMQKEVVYLLALRTYPRLDSNRTEFHNCLLRRPIGIASSYPSRPLQY